VSYVLNGVSGQRIAEPTRAKVLAAAERLGYTQNAVARTLQRGHSSVVVLALPPLPLGPPVGEAVTSICREVSLLGYTPLVMIEQSDDGGSLVRACHEVQAVGVIAPCENFRPGVLAQISASGAQAIISFGDTAVPGTYSLVGTQESVGKCAVEYLMARGYRDIVGVVPADGPLEDVGRRRSAGARAVCRAGGARYRSLPTPLELGSLGVRLARAMTERRPDAVFAFNDETAFMVVRHLIDGGLRIPEDVAVIGCDDSPVAALFQPSLTSVRAPWTSLAEPLRKLLSGELVTGSGKWHDLRVVPRSSA
jgi:DNA-binding LacI/PurR family transcriptional regulator